MRLSELLYDYPESLVATEPKEPCRIALKCLNQEPQEITKEQLFAQFEAGDVLVINDTRVEKRRIFSGQYEILFVRQLNDLDWEILMPSRDLAVGDQFLLPGGVLFTLTAKGLPQTAKLNVAVGPKYFEEYGEPALPPYIQRSRNERRARLEDHNWYQTAWATALGSSAAPTASLHFQTEDLEELRRREVEVVALTLHVGLGTFLPIKADNLDQHTMHAEWVCIPPHAQMAVEKAKARGGRVWALGTTTARALEAWGAGHLERTETGDLMGETSIFIKPGYSFTVVDGLLTNFHQPGSTLLAMVAALAGLENVKQVYQWAIERKFRLFSYGDLSVWKR